MCHIIAPKFQPGDEISSRDENLPYNRALRCQSDRHHTAICNHEKTITGEKHKDESNRDTVLMVAEPRRVSVILQTANAIAADNFERNKKKVRILLDP